MNHNCTTWPHNPPHCGCPAFAQVRATFAVTDPAMFGATPGQVRTLTAKKA